MGTRANRYLCILEAIAALQQNGLKEAYSVTEDPSLAFSTQSVHVTMPVKIAHALKQLRWAERMPWSLALSKQSVHVTMPVEIAHALQRLYWAERLPWSGLRLRCRGINIAGQISSIMPKMLKTYEKQCFVVEKCSKHMKI